MVGALIVSILAVMLAGFGELLLRKVNQNLDPAAKWGINGLVGLGATGTTVFFATLAITSHFAAGIAVLLGLAGLYGLFKSKASLKIANPEPTDLLALLGIFIAIGISKIGALAPSTAIDWDSLAYHLAVPKLWLLNGHPYSVPNLSHSNFPAAFDTLFMVGLELGKQQGAKFFCVWAFIFGLMAIFGLARAAFGKNSAWIAALLFAGIPLVVWEAGTAYIDVPHGLYGGLGLWLAATMGTSANKRNTLILSAVLLSLSASTKYTGILVIFVAFIVATWSLASQKQEIAKALKAGFAVSALAAALCAPWYIRNIVWTGNPVYPFLYSKLGGKSWNEDRTRIYTHEQNTFGVGHTATTEQPDQALNPLQPGRLGHSILGLAYTPGRYINPGQTAGLGVPFGAIGAAIIATLLLGLATAKPKSTEGVALVGCVLMLVAWFGLSQQSRYVLSIAPCLAIIGGSLAAKPVLKYVVGALACIQLGYTAYLIDQSLLANQLSVVLGQVTEEQYLSKFVPFSNAAQEINKLPKGSKIALYDEVFGYFLDIPYMWANPGHGMTIPYDDMHTGHDYVTKMKELGFTHVYINLFPPGSVRDPGIRWIAAAGLNGPAKPYTKDEPGSPIGNFELAFKNLTAQAAASGEMKVELTGKTWVLFSLN